MLALQAAKRCTSYGISVRLSVRPSVRPSVTRRYSVKTTARSTVQFALSDSKMCLVCRNQKYSPGTTPSPWNLGSKWPTISW